MMGLVGCACLLFPETSGKPLPDLVKSRHRMISMKEVTRLSNAWEAPWWRRWNISRQLNSDQVSIVIITATCSNTRWLDCLTESILDVFSFLQCFLWSLWYVLPVLGSHVRWQCTAERWVLDKNHREVSCGDFVEEMQYITLYTETFIYIHLRVDNISSYIQIILHSISIVLSVWKITL